MKTAALKAIALDERNSDAHVYLGDAKRVLDWDLPGVEAELNRALQLDPNSATAHLFLALAEGTQGKFHEIETHMRAAIKGDPLSPIVSNFSAILLLGSGHVDEAIAEAKRTLQLDPTYVYGGSILAEAYEEKGMHSEAIELFKKAAEMTGIPQSGLAVTYAHIGRLSEARLVLEELKKRAAEKYVAGDEIAVVHVALGEKDEAFKWLDRAYEEHSGSLQAIAVRPAFRPLHSDPRYAAILKRMGLDAASILARDTAP